MFSTFHGLETAKRGMNTQQSALYVTGQNISNANTLGYTRQRVNFEASPAYPAASMNRPQIPGQMGTGVQAGSIQRVRESFIDQQYRGENNKFGYWSTKAESLAKLEDIMNEPSDSGLSAAMGQFWQALQDLSANPENDGARSVVIQRGKAVAETFHYLNDSLKGVQKDLGNEISVSVKNMNSILEQIANVNKQISEIEPHGYVPNDLYDERDRLVDELSTYVDIKIEVEKSGGNPSKIAEGIYNIKLVGKGGGEGPSLIDGSTPHYLEITGGDMSDPKSGIQDKLPSDGSFVSFEVDGTPIDFEKFSQGKIRGLIESYGYDDNKGTYPKMLEDLDKLAYSFVTIFNAVHKKGYTLDETVKTGQGFFNDLTDYKGAAGKISVLENLSNKNIAASGPNGEAGNGINAINLANIKNMDFAKLAKEGITLEGFPDTDKLIVSGLPLDSGNISTNYQSIIGTLGVDAQQANRLTTNSGNLLQSVDERRQSVSAVSIDEEFINMIKYQQAYNASARNITIVDEMLDKIINGMGLGGR
ncbi:flagellar hook-associated protein FlgK [Heyndrickxia oleronia]|jgi:flagellar hook-associated protein 1 FlgK|uniref:flagellar hook-associated protein FlgK n=1 Tax=Heyndrickxia oleronia TaxID=38875 RepID=UPI002431B661|nr:flagellar hook-associated protein FlgK [Heyndrickxia oleronia]MCI1592498.1 flagellar hook-associated protein FlgK [Heyndrickxia oleronia]MCI1615400.1 flagellar hook-associated protein FlgK [Heyndrickxia oleronia]MCI1746202.1 flagellar hook-associated protein FlgK [Heyndrickxia oleronia]MCI1763690.1 flagellar hook-associated protein FlgK [Heyndrickxia oleronia]